MKQRVPWRKRVLRGGPFPGEERRARAAEASDQDRAAYLEALERAREATIGKGGKKVRVLQSRVYTALQLDPKAGYDGQPPAFLPEKEVNAASQAVGSGFRNIVRDPVHRLWIRRDIDDGQYAAAKQVVALIESVSTIGVRGVSWGEKVDGGRLANVPVEAMARIRRLEAFRGYMGRDYGIVYSICVERGTMEAVGRLHGLGRKAVGRRFRAALDRAARFF